MGVEIKHLYLTSGESDLVIFVDAPSGDNVAKFALAVSSLGNVRTRTAVRGQQMNIESSFPSYLNRRCGTSVRVKSRYERIVCMMSALPTKADIETQPRNVRFAQRRGLSEMSAPRVTADLHCFQMSWAISITLRSLAR